MTLLSLIKFIINHPLNENNKTKAVIRFIKWQIGTRLLPFPIVYSFTEKSKLIIQKGMTGATGNLYCGLHEFYDMTFLIHFLRPEDFFVDVGANVGSYTVLAGSHVGARTFSVEPVPSTFSKLINNISINHLNERVTPFNLALGSKKGSVKFTSSFDTMNHVATAENTDTIEVPVETLDDLLLGQVAPVIMKIDVEGFETEVISGALKTLNNSGLKAIIIELNGSGSRYGYNELEIHNTLLKCGFETFEYDPKKRKLTHLDKFGDHNTIYIRDLDFVQHRLTTAPKIKILDEEI